MTQSYRLGRFRSTVMGNIVGIVVLCMMLVVGSTTLGLYQIRQSSEKLRFVVESEYPLSAALSTIVAHRMEQSLLMEKLLRMRLSGTVSDAAYVSATKTRFDLLTSQIRDEFNDASARIQSLAAGVTAKESSEIIGDTRHCSGSLPTSRHCSEKPQRMRYGKRHLGMPQKPIKP